MGSSEASGRKGHKRPRVASDHESGSVAAFQKARLAMRHAAETGHEHEADGPPGAAGPAETVRIVPTETPLTSRKGTGRGGRHAARGRSPEPAPDDGYDSRRVVTLPEARPHTAPDAGAAPVTRPGDPVSPAPWLRPPQPLTGGRSRRSGLSEKRRRQGRAVALLAVLVLVAGTVALIVGAGDDATDDTAGGPAATSTTAAPAPAAPPPVVTPAGGDATHGQFAVAGQTIVVVATAKADCFVQIAIDGNVVFEGTLSAGQEQRVETGGYANLRIGAPAALTLTANGGSVPLPATDQPYDVHLYRAG